MCRTRISSVYLALLACAFVFTHAYAVDGNSTIITIAGGGAGDGGPATTAALNRPTRVVVDGAGNLYIPDPAGKRVRKVDASGVITTVAGNGNAGYSGDGGLATNAQLAWPIAVAIDASGNLYIADGQNRIRKVDANGIISTVAGNGMAGYSGDGGPATQAEFDLSYGNTRYSDIAVDAAGNLYIADTDNERIRKIDTRGIVTTVAGNGSEGNTGDGGLATNAELSSPTGVAVGKDGRLYVADTDNARVRKVDTNGKISGVAGNGTWGYSGDGGRATEAELGGPSGVAADAFGNLYIAALKGRIRKVDANGTITTVAGNGSAGNSGDGGPAISAQLNLPNDVAVDSEGRVYIADSFNNRIRVVGTNHLIDTIAGNGTSGASGDGGPAMNAQIEAPSGIAVGAAGDIFFGEYWNRDIRKVDASRIISTVYNINYYGGSDFSTIIPGIPIPTVVGADNLGNLYVADTLKQRVFKINAQAEITTVAGTGTQGFSGDGGSATNAQLNYPYDVAIDSAGNLYIADYRNARIRKVDINGIISTVAGNGTGGTSGDGGPALDATIVAPNVTVDSDGNLYFADAMNDRVRKIATDGIITTVAGDGARGFSGDGGAAVDAKFAFPSGVAADSMGNLYIADVFNHRLRKVDSAGIITTVAGDGTSANTGDGGSAADAALAGPADVAVDGSDNVYIAVAGRIREIVNASTTAGINPDQHGLTGSWYNPATSGQGLEIEVYPDLAQAGRGLLFGAWFTYDVNASGGRRWYVLSGDANSDSPVVNLQIGIAQNGSLDAPPGISAHVVGTAQIKFSDCTHATLDYSFADGSGRRGTISMVRLTPNVTCSNSGDSDNPASTFLLSGSWYNPDTSGQGFVFDFSPSISNMFGAWFTYKTDGQQIPGTQSQDWYTLQSDQFKPGMSSLNEIPIVQSTGGVFDNNASTTVSQVGTADIAIQSCNAMTLTYHFTAGSNKDRSGTINLRRTGPTPAGCSL